MYQIEQLAQILDPYIASSDEDGIRQEVAFIIQSIALRVENRKPIGRIDAFINGLGSLIDFFP